MHEQSETIQLPNGKWVNVYGAGTKKAGTILPGEKEYDTVEEAVARAKQRSAEADDDHKHPAAKALSKPRGAAARTLVK